MSEPKSSEIYRRVSLRMHADEKVRALSRPQPNGHSMWMALLTGEQTGIIPGLCKIGEVSFADQLGWDLKGFREAFREVSEKGMAKADWGARVVWVPKAIHHNPPASPNVITHWRVAWELMPECSLKDEAWETLKAFFEDRGEAWAKAFAKACPKPSVKAIANQVAGSRKQVAEEKQQLPAAPSAPPVAAHLPELPGIPPAPAPPAGSTEKPKRESTAKPGFAPLKAHFEQVSKARTGEDYRWSPASAVGCNSLLGALGGDVERCCDYLDKAFALADRQLVAGDTFLASNLTMAYLGGSEGMNRVRNALTAEKAKGTGPPRLRPDRGIIPPGSREEHLAEAAEEARLRAQGGRV